jgi:hypothetical protein
MTAAGGAQNSPIMLKDRCPGDAAEMAVKRENPEQTPKENYLNLELEPSVTSAWISHACRAA